MHYQLSNNQYYSLSNIIERFIARRIAKKSGLTYHEVLMIRDKKRNKNKVNLDIYIQHGICY